MQERPRWYIEVVTAGKNKYYGESKHYYTLSLNSIRKFINNNNKVDFKKLRMGLVNKYVMPSVLEKYKKYPIKSIKIKEVRHE